MVIATLLTIYAVTVKVGRNSVCKITFAYFYSQLVSEGRIIAEMGLQTWSQLDLVSRLYE